jgi:hypothetical protein
LTAFVDACREPACVVCGVVAFGVRQYLRGVMGDGVNDVALRADWRRRGGLCARHWRHWRHLETPALSSAVLLRDLLGGALAPAPPPPRWRPRAQPPLASPACPACDVERVDERRAVAAFARVDPERFALALGDGRGFVCVRHTHALPAGALRDVCEARLQALLADVDAFIRANDHRFTGDLTAVGDAWLRAMRALGGDV